MKNERKEKERKEKQIWEGGAYAIFIALIEFLSYILAEAEESPCLDFAVRGMASHGSWCGVDNGDAGCEYHEKA